MGPTVFLRAQVTRRGARAGATRRGLGILPDAAHAPLKAGPQVKTRSQGRSVPLGEAPPRTSAAAALPGGDHAVAVPGLVLRVQTPKVVPPPNGLTGTDVVGALQPTKPPVTAARGVPATPLVPAPSQIPLSTPTRQTPRQLQLQLRPQRRLPLPHPTHPAGDGAPSTHADVPFNAGHTLTTPLRHGLIKPLLQELTVRTQHTPRPLHLTLQRPPPMPPTQGQRVPLPASSATPQPSDAAISCEGTPAADRTVSLVPGVFYCTRDRVRDARPC